MLGFFWTKTRHGSAHWSFQGCRTSGMPTMASAGWERARRAGPGATWMLPCLDLHVDVKTNRWSFFISPLQLGGLGKEIISLVNKNQKHLGLHPIAPILASLRRCLPSPTRATSEGATSCSDSSSPKSPSPHLDRSARGPVAHQVRV